MSNLPKCPICLNEFDTKVHVPRSFPCLHSLCHVCIPTIFEQKQPCCMICRAEIKEKLLPPINYALFDVLKHMEKEGKVEQSGNRSHAVEQSAFEMDTTEIELRMKKMLKNPEDSESRKFAYTEFLKVYGHRILPDKLLKGMTEHIKRHPMVTSDDLAKYFCQVLDEHELWITSTQVQELSEAIGYERLSGQRCSSAIIPRVVDLWNLRHDAMDGCAVECFRPYRLYAKSADDIWAILHSQAMKMSKSGGNCCQVNKLLS
jgi:hypothetical protein